MTTERQDEKTAKFIGEVSSVGGQCVSAPDLSNVRDHVAKIVSTSAARRVAVGDQRLASRLFPQGAGNRKFEVITPSSMSRDEFFVALRTVDVGVSGVDLAVAETGTLIIVTREESERLVTALPQIHVAILPLSKLVSSFQEAERFVSRVLESSEGTAISLISGTSRTTDIGDVVISGVHGPRELHVFLLDQESAGSD